MRLSVSAATIFLAGVTAFGQAASTAPATKSATSTAPASAKSAAIFLSAADGAKVLASDDPPYLSLLKMIESQGKTGSAMNIATLRDPKLRFEELKKRYAAAALDFSPAEIETINWYVERLDKLAFDFPLFTATPWKFIKVGPNIENGFSHTRGDCIVFTAQTLGRLGVARKRTPDTAAYLAGGLLLHEKCHVIQRQHPKMMADLYTNVWKFEYASVDLGPWLSDRQLLNPDGVELRWVYKLPPAEAGELPKYILPLIAFIDSPEDPPTSFAGAAPVAVELNKTKTGYTIVMLNETKPKFNPIGKYADYVRAFPDANSIYHPNEIFADLFAMMIAKDTLSRSKIEPLTKEAPYGALREWLTKNFAKAIPAETKPAK
jgi:hypothetical protein